MGKLRWIERHMEERWLRRYIFTPVKEAFARPGVVLIDDCDANVTAFRDAGGRAVLVPRPWNAQWRLCVDDDSAGGRWVAKRLKDLIDPMDRMDGRGDGR
jgi:hypothetical protein